MQGTHFDSKTIIDHIYNSRIYTRTQLDTFRGLNCFLEQSVTGVYLVTHQTEDGAAYRAHGVTHSVGGWEWHQVGKGIVPEGGQQPMGPEDEALSLEDKDSQTLLSIKMTQSNVVQ